MTVQEVANILAKGEKVVTDYYIVETDDYGRIVMFEFKDKEKTKKTRRPNILGLYKNGEFRWSEKAQRAIEDIRENKETTAKTTIGTYVTHSEYDLVQKAAALCGLTAGSFVRKMAVRTAKLICDNECVNSLEMLDIIVK